MDVLAAVYNFVTAGVPSYAQTIKDVQRGVEYCYENCREVEGFTPGDFLRSLELHTKFDVYSDLPLIALGALGWTISRYILTYVLFKPIAKWFKLTAKNSEKFPESAWKFIVYTCLWSLTCYVIFGLPQYNHIFHDPDAIWNDYEYGLRIEPTVFYLYMMQLSLYVHSVYATLFMDSWRKDSIVMVFHHILTISLIGFSYAARYHKIGILVLFCHDITDICLEFTKCNVYFKYRNGRLHGGHELISNVGFLAFALTWVLFRLYWLPLKVLHSSGVGTMLHHQKTGYLPFYFFFNSMLWILQVLNIYWFMFIVIFVIKIATGQLDEVDDIREEEVLKKNAARLNGKNGVQGGTDKKTD